MGHDDSINESGGLINVTRQITKKHNYYAFDRVCIDASALLRPVASVSTDDFNASPTMLVSKWPWAPIITVLSKKIRDPGAMLLGPSCICARDPCPALSTTISHVTARHAMASLSRAQVNSHLCRLYNNIMIRDLRPQLGGGKGEPMPWARIREIAKSNTLIINYIYEWASCFGLTRPNSRTTFRTISQHV